MIKAVDIKGELAGRPILSSRGKETTEAEARDAFAVLAPFRDGSIFAGTVLSATPQPTEHTRAEDPRTVA